jgi:hypothetical protein
LRKRWIRQRGRIDRKKKKDLQKKQGQHLHQRLALLKKVEKS